jgi:hypothetical protein
LLLKPSLKNKIRLRDCLTDQGISDARVLHPPTESDLYSEDGKAANILFGFRPNNFRLDFRHSGLVLIMQIEMLESEKGCLRLYLKKIQGPVVLQYHKPLEIRLDFP